MLVAFSPISVAETKITFVYNFLAPLKNRKYSKSVSTKFMVEDDKSLGEVENWVKLHNEAVSKYDIYVEEIETRLTYITKLEEENAME